MSLVCYIAIFCFPLFISCFPEQPSGHPSKKPEEPTTSVDENGIVTIVEYAVNDEGKKVKVNWNCSVNMV